MRRILLIVAMLLIAAPAMAVPEAVVTATQTGSPACSNVDVTYDCNGAGEIRAFALDISVDNGCKITTITPTGRGPSIGMAPCIKCYGIFPGKFRDFINPTSPLWTDPNYNPVAPTGDPDANTGLGTGAITVELGSLYLGAENAPLSTGVLFKIDVVPPHPAMDCNLRLTKNMTRGGVVDISGNQMTKLNGCKVNFPDNFPCWQPYKSRYDNWKAFVNPAKPPCWCAAGFGGTGYQCDGDADQKKSGAGYRIYTGDSAILASCWKMKITNPLLNPCADIDQKASGAGYRVYTADSSIMAAHWKWKDPALPVPPNCPRP